MKCIQASKQDIIDYRSELVETGWTPREEDTDAEWKENSCLWCGKNMRLQQRVENANSAEISADANIICFIPQHHGHQHNVHIAERFLKW